MPFLRWIHFFLSFALILRFCFGVTQCYANERFPGKTFGLDVVAGVPQFIGLELSFLGWSRLSPVLSFGSAPINNFLNGYIKLAPVPVKLSATDTYNLYPASTFTLYSFSFYLKYLLSKSGFFTNLMFSSVTFSGTVYGDLKNETTGKVSSGLVTGSATLTQIMLGLTFGYQIAIQQSVFIEIAGGAGYLLPPIYSTTLSGSAASVVGILPNGEQVFDNAKSQVQASFDSAVSTYRASLKIVPFAFLTLGITF